MTTEQQDKTWACLPKEVRNEIKERYEGWNGAISFDTECILYEELFGNHNLSSNTEPSEMLMIERKKVQELYSSLQSRFENIEANGLPKRLEKERVREICQMGSFYGTMRELRALFNDKCLPEKDSDINVPKLKFKVGDNVRLTEGMYKSFIGIIKSYSEYDDTWAVMFDGAEYPINFPDEFLEPYTEETETERKNPQDLSLSNNQQTDNMEEKELNLCELLKGCEGETLYSPIIGDCKVKSNNDTYLYVTYLDNRYYCFQSNGCRENGGICVLYPSRALYENYPLDAAKAWAEWTESRKPKRWRADYGETYYSLRNDFSVCNQTENSDFYNDKAWNSYNYFRTEAEAQQAAEGMREYLQNFHENLNNEK